MAVLDNSVLQAELNQAKAGEIGRVAGVGGAAILTRTGLNWRFGYHLSFYAFHEGLTISEARANNDQSQKPLYRCGVRTARYCGDARHNADSVWG